MLNVANVGHKWISFTLTHSHYVTILGYLYQTQSYRFLLTKQLCVEMSFLGCFAIWEFHKHKSSTESAVHDKLVLCNGPHDDKNLKRMSYKCNILRNVFTHILTNSLENNDVILLSYLEKTKQRHIQMNK